MTTPARAARPAAKRPGKPAAKRSRKSATNVAIATELAPAVAIALLDKSEQAPGAAAPALEALAAGAVPSDKKGKVRVQLMFENGAVLPVEMSKAAGAALSKGLDEEAPRKVAPKASKNAPKTAARKVAKKVAKKTARK
jgi:hypothetical protein